MFENGKNKDILIGKPKHNGGRKKMKQSCIHCYHIEVCEIYKRNVKHLKELNIQFRVSTIADICPHYLDGYMTSAQKEKMNNEITQA